jgi:hypothetical protein
VAAFSASRTSASVTAASAASCPPGTRGIVRVFRRPAQLRRYSRSLACFCASLFAVNCCRRCSISARSFLLPASALNSQCARPLCPFRLRAYGWSGASSAMAQRHIVAVTRRPAWQIRISDHQYQHPTYQLHDDLMQPDLVRKVFSCKLQTKLATTAFTSSQIAS